MLFLIIIVADFYCLFCNLISMYNIRTELGHDNPVINTCFGRLGCDLTAVNRRPNPAENTSSNGWLLFLCSQDALKNAFVDNVALPAIWPG